MSPNSLLSDLEARRVGKSLTSRITNILPSLKVMGIALPLALSALVSPVQASPSTVTSMPKLELQGDGCKIVEKAVEPSIAPVGNYIAGSNMGEAIKSKTPKLELQGDGFKIVEKAVEPSAIPVGNYIAGPNMSEAVKQDISISNILEDPNNIQNYQGFDSKASAHFINSIKSLGSQPRIEPYEQSQFGTTTRGIIAYGKEGDGVVLALRESGPEAGMTVVNTLDSGGRIAKCVDIPSSVVFNDGKLKSIEFGKGEAPSYSDIASDCPSSLVFDDAGQLKTIGFGDSTVGTRTLSYKDGVLESVHSYEPIGTGGVTKFDSNGAVVPSSEGSTIREAYQGISPDNFLENFGPKLDSNGLAEHVAQLDASVDLFR